MTTRGSLPVEAPEGADRARHIVEGLGAGFLSLDAHWRFTDCNRNFERFLGADREELLGRVVWEISGVSRESSFGTLARRVATTRVAEEAEFAYPKNGDGRLLSVRVFPMDGGVGAFWRDITEARAAELQLAESEARYRELADHAPAAAWLSRADGGLEFINQAMADALGRSREELLGEGWLDAVDPDDRPALLEARRVAWSTHSPFHYEGRFRCTDGALRIIRLYGRPRFDGTGAFKGVVGTATDVTDVRDAERRQKLLIDELNHRVKNTLATVQFLVRQTLREDKVSRATESRLTDRLLALSAAHDVLTRENWEGAELADIARAAVTPFDVAQPITLAGPAARVAPNTAIALSMALFELATNALRHGALSAPSGQVRLTWTTNHQTIDLEWRESDGPGVAAPQRAGFGSRLLGPGLTGEFGEPAQLIFAPEGLICRIRAPAEGDDSLAHEG